MATPVDELLPLRCYAIIASVVIIEMMLLASWLATLLPLRYADTSYRYERRGAITARRRRERWLLPPLLRHTLRCCWLIIIVSAMSR